MARAIMTRRTITEMVAIRAKPLSELERLVDEVGIFIVEEGVTFRLEIAP
jgi:hypothetical protein